MVCEKGDGKLLMKLRDDFLKKVIRSPRSTPNGAAEWEIGSGRTKSKTLCRLIKYWCRVVLVEKDELLKNCYG
jgi:hypothetical protein